MSMELSVIIVNYNGLKYLKDCFNSLHDMLQGIKHEIIVTDNNSADASCDYIKQHYPDVVLIESKDNLGFGKGNNRAVQEAKGDYLLLINNDTIVLSQLKPVLDALKADATIGAIGINMLNANKEYLPVVGNFPNPVNLLQLKTLYNRESEFKTGNFTKDQYKVGWLGGSFLMIPKKVYTDINGFDNDYFMYGEDIDLCKRIADKGYSRVFMPQYGYIHFVGYNSSKDPLIIRGLEMYIAKHLKGLNKQMALLSLKINKAIKRAKKLLK